MSAYKLSLEEEFEVEKEIEKQHEKEEEEWFLTLLRKNRGKIRELSNKSKDVDNF